MSDETSVEIYDVKYKRTVLFHSKLKQFLYQHKPGHYRLTNFADQAQVFDTRSWKGVIAELKETDMFLTQYGASPAEDVYVKLKDKPLNDFVLVQKTKTVTYKVM